MVREPAQAVPGSIAERIGPLRVLMVPYIACGESGDVVCTDKPKGESHTAAWVDTTERTNLLLACREVDAHDTGFEFLASVAELLRPRLSTAELASYDELLDEELRHGVRGEIDEESLTAKQALLAIRPWRRSRLQYEPYRDVSAGEYDRRIHAWLVARRANPRGAATPALTGVAPPYDPDVQPLSAQSWLLSVCKGTRRGTGK